MRPEDLRLQEFLSEARYTKYVKAARGDSDRAARLFEWNARLSSAYWPSIALVEVAVRNAINTHLCRHLGVTHECGWHVEALSDKPRIHLVDRDRDKLQSSIETFRRRRTGENQNTEPTGDDVVGGTSLGLWVALCGEGWPRHPTFDYHRYIWRGKKLWQAFPHYGAWLVESGEKKTNPADTPGPLRGALRDFELLRNRIAHHEPIYMLRHDHHRENIAVIAGLIDHDLCAYIRHTDLTAQVCSDYATFVTGAEDRPRSSND